MRCHSPVIAFAILASTTVAAQGDGDAEAGKKAFRKCQSCHVIAAPDGEVLAGRSGRTGPNLYGMIGRAAGTVDGFNYGPSLVAAGDGGLIWTKENLASYLMNPTAFLREFTGDDSAKSRMSFRVRKEQEALDLSELIASFANE